jgi:alpha-mannosidase
MNDRRERVRRREFLATGVGTLGAAAFTPLLARNLLETSAGEPKKVLHIIGHSHIDAAWLWPWRDGEDEALNTFRSALNRMNETPDFRYSHSSSAHYRWVHRADPAMYAEIKRRIDEGRWEVLGGWLVEPDCNIPSTESFARHCLYGKNFIRRTLGVDVKIGFNPDSFGHAAGLPTILKHAGYGYYAFQRPGDKENTLPHVFWWEGPDGSRLLANRIWKGYDGDAEDIKDMLSGAFVEGLDHATFFLGVGDHGGAVTKKQIAKLLEMRSDPKMPELRFSTLKEFFTAVENSPALQKLPVVRGELQHHARGCYSAYGEGKQQNRRAELSLGLAESVCALAGGRVSQEYPKDELAESWWNILFCQFHDMMAGTSQYQDYQDVRDNIGYACTVANTHKVEALEALARQVDTQSVVEGAVLAYNPLPWPRKVLLEYQTDTYPGDPPSEDNLVTHLKSQAGEKIPVQWLPPPNMSGGQYRLSTWVNLPACGYEVFALAHGADGRPPGQGDFPSPMATPSDVGFGISSIKAADGTELLAAPIGLVVISDTSDTWSHGINKFRQEIGRPELYSSLVVENGPVTRVTRHRARWHNSDVVMEIAQFASIDIVELRFVIDWHEHEQILKLEIPTALTEPEIHAKVPGAALRRTTNGEEEPYQDWVAISGKRGKGEYTLALLNDSTYSYDCLDGLLRTILIRSVGFARHNPAKIQYNDTNAWQDQGRQERRFWLRASAGTFETINLDRLAKEVQTPAEYIMTSAHGGALPWRESFLEISPSSVEVLAVKHAEGESGGTIIRLQERAGKQTEATLKSAFWNLNHAVKLEPWQMKTLRVELGKGKSGSVKEVSLLET